jgi:hypothetical protein
MSDRHDLTSDEARKPPRFALVYLVIGITMLVAVGLAAIVPVAEADGNAFRWPALLPIGTAAAMGGGLAWLVLTIMGRRKRR